jgi:hypothetical protein
VVWAALIVGLGSGVIFLGSGLVWRLGGVRERLLHFSRKPRRDALADRAEARILGERLATFDALREELLLRALRAKLGREDPAATESDLAASLEAFRKASGRFLELAEREIRDGEQPR